MIPLCTTGTETVASLLRDRATGNPDTPFLLFDSSPTPEFTYAGTYELACRGAAALSALGVTRGDRFGMAIGNAPEFFACWFGAALLGAVAVPMNPQSTVAELHHMLGHSGCRAVVAEPSAVEACAQAVAPGVRVVATGEELDRLMARPWHDDGHVGEPTDPLAVLYTSGTTSLPKGVVVTNANYLVAGEVVSQVVRMRPDDRWLVVLPMFHANAQYYCTMSALVSGASVAVAPRFSASSWAAQAQRTGATLGSLFAAPIRMLLAQPPNAGDRDNRLRATFFAQNLTHEQLADFESRFGCPLVQWYGMTETIAPPVANPLLRTRDNMTIGLPVGAPLRVVDPDGHDVGPNGIGELLVGGQPGLTLMAGYLDDPAATDAAIRDGWLHTGDVVRITPSGMLAFHDRSKDMIKRSGENVAAAEVERVVNEHPTVFESAAIGVPDAVRDEAIKVYVVLHEGAVAAPDEIISFCSERMVKFKVPSFVEIVDRLPRTSVGKIQKHVLRRGEDTR